MLPLRGFPVSSPSSGPRTTAVTSCIRWQYSEVKPNSQYKISFQMTQLCNNAVHCFTIIRIQLLIGQCHKAPLLYLLWSQIIRVVLPTEWNTNTSVQDHPGVTRPSFNTMVAGTAGFTLIKQSNNENLVSATPSFSRKDTKFVWPLQGFAIGTVLQVSSLKQAEVLKMWPVIIAGINSGREGWQWR